MARLNREMSRLFGETRASSGAGVFPPLNLYDDGESLIVRAEIPGIDPKDIDVQATVNSLTIKGERKRSETDEKASFHRRERGHGTFSRTISLPEEIDPDKVAASYSLGVLQLLLPKAEETKPRKIEIQA
jgi:HSP20 family protein